METLLRLLSIYSIRNNYLNVALVFQINIFFLLLKLAAFCFVAFGKEPSRHRPLAELRINIESTFICWFFPYPIYFSYGNFLRPVLLNLQIVSSVYPCWISFQDLLIEAQRRNLYSSEGESVQGGFLLIFICIVPFEGQGGGIDGKIASSCQICSVHFDNSPSISRCHQLASSQWPLVYQRLWYMLSCLRDNTCIRSIVICLVGHRALLADFCLSLNSLRVLNMGVNMIKTYKQIRPSKAKWNDYLQSLSTRGQCMYFSHDLVYKGRLQ